MPMRLHLVFVALFVGCVSESAHRTGSEAAADSQEHINDARFQAVKETFERQGVRVERDPRMRDTVRMYFPASVTLELSKLQAKNLASEARARLGTRAIVYIKNLNGDTIAKAAPWGLE